MSEGPAVLIVDDEPKICQFLDVFLRREGYRPDSVCRAADAIEKVKTGNYDIVITDLKMPGMDGFELVEKLKAIRRDLPVVMITGYATVETAVQALRHGVDDYITKPFNIDEMRKVLDRLLRSVQMERETSEIEKRCLDMLKTLVHASEAKDKYLCGHSRRVAGYAAALADVLGMDAGQRNLLKNAAELHDIGKVAVSDSILDKPDLLSNDERDLVRHHPSLGEEIIGQIDGLQELRPIIRHHHERLDGRGYPDGLKGEAIPRLARILSIADAYDAMTSPRPYRPAHTTDEARREILSCIGKQFDEDLADVFCEKVVSSRVGD